MMDRIKSVLSEVYAAQKRAAPAALNPPEVVSIVRKAQQRRVRVLLPCNCSPVRFLRLVAGLYESVPERSAV
jgi:hypothetical protein